nr:MAG TPA: hypothetical protein [Caudoviricetes sp.]
MGESPLAVSFLSSHSEIDRKIIKRRLCENGRRI